MPRKIFPYTLILTAITLGSLAAFLPKASAETACQRIQRINAPRVAEFSARYALSSPALALAAIQESDSVELARSKYLSLAPERRKAVWQAKFAQVDAGKYAPARARVIKKAIELIDTLKFDGSDDVQPVRALGDEVREVFDKGEATALFASLSASPSLMKASASLGKCNCSQIDNWCNEGYTCLFSPGMWYCSYQSWGCGLFWIYPCDGMCA